MTLQSLDVVQTIFVALSAATCLLSLILSRMLGGVVVILRRQRHRARHVSTVAAGASMPVFEGTLVDSGARFTNRDLIPPAGQLSSVVFLRPREFDSDPVRMRYIVDRIHKDTPRFVHVVCSDSVEACAALHDNVLGRDIPTIVDSDGAISRAFRATRRAVAIYIDSQGLIVRRGNEVTPRHSPPNMGGRGLVS